MLISSSCPRTYLSYLGLCLSVVSLACSGEADTTLEVRTDCLGPEQSGVFDFVGQNLNVECEPAQDPVQHNCVAPGTEHEVVEGRLVEGDAEGLSIYQHTSGEQEYYVMVPAGDAMPGAACRFSADGQDWACSAAGDRVCSVSASVR